MAIGSTSSARNGIGAGEVETPRPAWARWLLPSIGDLIFVVMLALFTLTGLSVRLLGDAGIGWHIRTGQLILATHAIPRVDPFSSSMTGQPWFAWEWLYDVIVGWLDRAAGLNGVVLFTALMIAMVFAWSYRLLQRRGTNVAVALMLVLLAAGAAMIHFLARPHVVSWLFTLLWFSILESSDPSPGSSGEIVREDEAKASGSRTPNAGCAWLPWLLPPSMLLWVNLHGGFLVGFALLGIYSIDAVVRWFGFTGERQQGFEDLLQKIRAGRRARCLAVTAGLSGLATLVNPYGWRLHLHVYRYLSNRFLMDHIDEFQSPNFHLVAQRCFAGLLLLTLVALATQRRASGERRTSEGLVVLFAVYSGLYASRNIPISSLLLILVIGPRLSDAMAGVSPGVTNRRVASLSRDFSSSKPSFLRRMQAIDGTLRGHLWPAAAVLLICWIAAHGGRLGATPFMDAHFDGKRFPVRAVNYLEEHKVQGPVLAPDYWGGYLIYRLYPTYPTVRVVVDDRHDFYGEEFLKSYLKMVHVEPGWDQFLRANNPYCVLVPANSALGNIMAEGSDWKIVDADGVARMFVRAGE